MTFTTADYRILLEFEQARTEGKSVSEFAKQNNPSIGAELQLELIGIDLEIRMQLGDPVLIEEYLYDFPHLCARIPKVFAEVKADFLNSFCPVRGEKRSFPLRFAEYEITHELGRGGMGVVYAATDLTTNREVAIKVLFLKRQQILNEANTLSQVAHPNVCCVLKTGQYNGLPFMVMERVDGQSLKKCLRATGPFSNQRSAEIVCKIAKALECAHKEGVVHFDVKLSNVLIGSSFEEPRVTDFGLAIKATSETIDMRSDMLGSPPYMAPEFFDEKFGRPGQISDVYSLGIVLYELLTGAKPFCGRIKELIEHICERPASRPTDYSNVNVDPKLEEICLCAISKNVEDRFQTMGEFAQALELWMGAQRKSRRPAERVDSETSSTLF